MNIYADTKESPFDYLHEVMSITDTIKPKRVLVIWTAWFTYPYQLSKLDYVEQIDAVDIDGSIQTNRWDLFSPRDNSHQKSPLSRNRQDMLINQAIKAWKSYDLILLDAYNGKTLPDELATVEFFAWIKQLTCSEWAHCQYFYSRQFFGQYIDTQIYCLLDVHVFDDVHGLKNVTQYTAVNSFRQLHRHDYVHHDDTFYTGFYNIFDSCIRTIWERPRQILPWCGGESKRILNGPSLRVQLGAG
jgi:hypothetical protein